MATEEFEVDGAAAVFSTWRVEEDGEVADVRALGARMSDERAARLLAILPGGEFLIRIKFLRDESDWVIEDKFDPVRGKEAVLEIARDTKPAVLTGIDKVYYQNAYPVTAVIYGLYPIRDPDLANLDPLRDCDLNCVAQRVIEHFEGALRSQGLTPARRLKIQEREERVHETAATVDDVAELEKSLKRSIILRGIAGENIFNSGKYQRGGNGVRGVVELICHNGHAW